MIKTVSIAGSGNVGWHLAHALHDQDVEIRQIISRNSRSASELALAINAEAANSFSHVKKVDLLILALPDDEIKNLDFTFPTDQLVAHTSGSVEMSEITGRRSAVFYPLQTFSKSTEVNFSEVPLCIEATEPLDQTDLLELGNRLSTNVQQVNSEQRKSLHLAAVFASNFANQMYREAEMILAEANLDLKLLAPLIREVAAKIDRLPPKEAMTGPAKRGDLKTLEKHLGMLKSSPESQHLYKLITQRIQSDQED